MTILPATDYYVRVKAVGLTGESEYSDTIKVTTLESDNTVELQTPTIPNILHRVVDSNQTILYIEHIDTRNTYTYTLSTNSDYSAPIYENIAILSNQLVSHFYNGTKCDLLLLPNLTANTTYYLKIKTSNNLGASSYREINFTTRAALLPPEPLGITNLTNTSATLNWSPVNGATGYRIDISSSSNFSSYVIENLDLGNVLSYTVSPLLEDTVYYARIRAYNVSITSNNSTTYNFQTLIGVDTETTLSNRLQSVAITSIYNLNTTEYSLRWNITKNYNKVESLAATIYTSTNNTFTNIVDTSNTTNNFAVINGLTANTTYYVKVEVTNGFDSVESNYLTLKTLAISEIINAPTVYTVTDIGATIATINYSIVNNADRYYLELSTLANFSNIVQTVYLSSNVNSYIFNNLIAATQYYVRICALDNLYASNFSSVETFTTTTALPAISLNSPTVVSESEVQLSWNINAAYSKYYLTIFNQYGYIGNGFYRKFDLGYVSNYTVKLFLTAGTQYSYLITGVTELGEIKESAIDVFTTKYLPPSIYIDNQSSSIIVEGKANRLYVSTDSNFSNCLRGYSPYDFTTIADGSLPLSTLLRDSSAYYIKASYYVNDQESLCSNVITTKESKVKLYTDLITHNSCRIRFNNLITAKYILQLQYWNVSVFENVGNQIHVENVDTYEFINLTSNSLYKVKVYDENYAYITDLEFYTNVAASYNENLGLTALSVTNIPYVYDVKLNISNLSTDKVGIEVYTSNNYLKSIEYIESNLAEIVIPNLKSNYTYYLRVFRIVGNERSAYTTLNFTTNSITSVPSAINTSSVLSNLTLLNNHEVELTYTPVANAHNYLLQLSTNSNFEYLIDTPYYVLANKLVITNLLPTTTYYARLYATNGIYRSQYSNSVEIYTGN